MRKFLLLGTVFMATTAFAFGGIFGGGGNSSSRKTAGVDAIGVHVNGKGTKPNIDVRTCDSETEELVGSECCKKTLIYTDNDTTKCCSLEGYAVQDGKCKKQCGWGWTLNEESNECECPEERQCGETCCGTGNICEEDENGKKWCCHEKRGDWAGDESWCCDPSASTGYSSDDESCCDSGSVAFKRDEAGETSCCASGNEPLYGGSSGFCCPNNSVLLFDEVYEQYRCCPANTVGIGGGECCQAGTSIARNADGEPFCCSNGSLFYGRHYPADYEQCCPTVATSVNEYNECCGLDIPTYENPEDSQTHCCAGSLISYDYMDEDDHYQGQHCCPEGATDFTFADGCI